MMDGSMQNVRSRGQGHEDQACAGVANERAPLADEWEVPADEGTEVVNSTGDDRTGLQGHEGATHRVTYSADVRQAPSQRSAKLYTAAPGKFVTQMGDAMTLADGSRYMPLAPRGWIDCEALEPVGEGTDGPSRRSPSFAKVDGPATPVAPRVDSRAFTESRMNSRASAFEGDVHSGMPHGSLTPPLEPAETEGYAPSPQGDADCDEGYADDSQMFYAWDHPLSRADIYRRVTIQCNRLRSVAAQQMFESARTTSAARDLVRVHAGTAEAAVAAAGAAADRVQELEKQCQEASREAEEANREAASANQEVTWLKKMMEAMVGLEGAEKHNSEAARYVRNARERMARAVSVPSGARYSLQQNLQDGGGGSRRAASPKNRSPAADSASPAAVKSSPASSDANHRTVMRRIRRRNCRARYMAMEKAGDANANTPEGTNLTKAGVGLTGTPSSVDVTQTPNPHSGGGSASAEVGSAQGQDNSLGTPRRSRADVTKADGEVSMAVPASWYIGESSTDGPKPQNSTRAEHFNMFTVRDEDQLSKLEQPSTGTS